MNGRYVSRGAWIAASAIGLAVGLLVATLGSGGILNPVGGVCFLAVSGKVLYPLGVAPWEEDPTEGPAAARSA